MATKTARRPLRTAADVEAAQAARQQEIEALTEQLQGALNSRIAIEQAKGALARQEGITVDEAFERMRQRARSSRQRLVDVAAIVLAGN